MCQDKAKKLKFIFFKSLSTFKSLFKIYLYLKKLLFIVALLGKVSHILLLETYT